MLSDRERATFHKIQRQLSAEDQSRQFSAENQGSVPSPDDRPTRQRRDPVQFPGPRTTLTWIMATLCVLTFLAGSLGGALVFAAAVLVRVAVAPWGRHSRTSELTPRALPPPAALRFRNQPSSAARGPRRRLRS